MSSYFDTMGACVESPHLIAMLVAVQYGSYLREVDRRMSGVKARDEFERKVVRPFYELDQKLKADQIGAQDFVRRVHDLAHTLGTMRLSMKSGRFAGAGDNPWGIAY